MKTYNPHNLTPKQLELLTVLQNETNDYVTKEMACFLLSTTPQALGRLALALSKKNLCWRDSAGKIWIEKSI